MAKNCFTSLHTNIIKYIETKFIFTLRWVLNSIWRTNWASRARKLAWTLYVYACGKCWLWCTEHCMLLAKPVTSRCAFICLINIHRIFSLLEIISIYIYAMDIYIWNRCMPEYPLKLLPTNYKCVHQLATYSNWHHRKQVLFAWANVERNPMF